MTDDETGRRGAKPVDDAHWERLKAEERRYLAARGELEDEDDRG